MPGLYGKRSDQREPTAKSRPVWVAGPWHKLPPGYTIPGFSPPVRPLCGHSSPVAPGSQVWTEDCDEPARYARTFADAEEYACAQHATRRP